MRDGEVTRELSAEQLLDSDEYREKCLTSGAAPSSGDVFEYELAQVENSERDPNRVLTAQEARFCAFLRQGMHIELAANAAGLSIPAARELVQTTDVVAAAVRHSSALQSGSIIVTRDMLTLMLLEERERSGTASEGVAAIREIGRLNGLYPEQHLQRIAMQQALKTAQRAEGAVVDGEYAEKQQATRSELSRMNDEQLMELAGCQVHNRPSDRRQK